MILVKPMEKVINHPIIMLDPLKIHILVQLTEWMTIFILIAGIVNDRKN